MARNPVKNKLFWAWVAVEVVVAGTFGWLIASAETKPWARMPRRKKGSGR